MFQSRFTVIALLAWRGLKQHAFSSFVAVFTISMAGGLFLSTWKIKEEAQKAFSNSSGGFDAVLGARGSKLQLILNAMFHLEACLLYTSPSPRDATLSRMPSSA